MSGYGYGPPPPPPSSSGYGPPSASYSHQGQSRGGGSSQGTRGRGGQYPRPRDYHPPPAHYEYASQSYPTNHASYGGSHPSAGSYPTHPSQWTPDHGGHAPHAAQPHAPAPLSSTNYHPNYAPPSYPSSAQHPQPPSYGPTQPYGQPYQGHPAANPPHWPAPGPPQPSHYPGSRGRGGYSDRGGSKPPHSGGPGRHAYEHEPVPATAPYGQPYSHDSRIAHYPPPSIPYARPPPPSSATRQDNRFGQHSRRGRGGGGGHRDGARGRGGHHSNSNQHHGKNRPNSHNKSNQNDNKPKAEPPSVGKKKKRKVNTLGLTPGVESESEDDEGEEKALTELIGAETLQISDVATFLAERRKNYPTKARVEAKKAAQKSLDKTAELEKQADKLRKQLAKVESSIKRKREQGDEGDEMRGPAENSSGDEKPEVMSSRSKAAPPPPSAKKADVSRHCKYYSTGGTCGKKGKCRFVHDPEVREAAIKEREANHGRLTIQQRLILNDKEQEDLTVLQSIQYIRQKNLMESESSKAEDGEEAQPMNKEKDKDENDAQNIVTPALATSGSSLLPVAPASLPAPPPKKETSIPSHSNPPPSVGPAAESTSDGDAKQCEGWLLQPYGNSNGESSKADDLP